MIAQLEGTVSEIAQDGVIISIGGVGFFAQTPTSVLTRLKRDESAKLYTKMLVREDDISLVGFLAKEDLSLFNMLTAVSGVGAKAALSLLGALTASQIALAILTEDAEQLSKAPGIGKKTAARLCVELKDKLSKASAQSGIALPVSPQQPIFSTGATQDAADALTALGYSRAEALKTVLEVALDGMDAPSIIKLALKKLSSKY